jgi:hypothetical protein
MHLKPPLEPHLAKHGLEWSDVVPVLEEVESIDELKEAAADVGSFLEKLANASGPAAKKLAIMHLKPKLAPHLAKQGLEWADVVPVLEEVESIDELKEAVEYPMAFLDRVSKAGAESLGIAISASLHVLKVVPGGQGARNNVQTGDVISRVGSTNLSYDGSTQMDVEIGSLLNEARTRGEAFVRIEFNDGAKSAEFKVTSRLTAAMASGKSQIMHQKLTTTRRGSVENLAGKLEKNMALENAKESLPARQTINPTLEEESATVVGFASSTLATTASTRPTFAPADEDSSFHIEYRCPSPSEHMQQLLEEGVTVKEQREHERREAQRAPALDTDALAFSSVNTLFAKIAEESSSMIGQKADQDGTIPTSVVPMQAEAGAQLEPLPRDTLQSALSAAAVARTPAYGQDIGIDMDSSVVRQLARDLGLK